MCIAMVVDSAAMYVVGADIVHAATERIVVESERTAEIVMTQTTVAVSLKSAIAAVAAADSLVDTETAQIVLAQCSCRSNSCDPPRIQRDFY